MTSPPTTYEIMVTTAARMLHYGDLLLVRIGLPSGAANLARRTRCPNLVQIDECAAGSHPDWCGNWNTSVAELRVLGQELAAKAGAS